MIESRGKICKYLFLFAPVKTSSLASTIGTRLRVIRFPFPCFIDSLKCFSWNSSVVPRHILSSKRMKLFANSSSNILRCSTTFDLYEQILQLTFILIRYSTTYSTLVHTYIHEFLMLDIRSLDTFFSWILELIFSCI